MNNVVWVLAYKDSGGSYQAAEFVHPDITSGIEEAATLLAEDGACDPRLIQVILDPCSPLLLEADLRALLEREKAQALEGEEDGLQKAINLLEDRALLHTDDLEQAADPSSVAEHILETLEEAMDAAENESDEDDDEDIQGVRRR